MFNCPTECLITLPHSQITIAISTGFGNIPTSIDKNLVEAYYDKNGKLYEWENTILPDVYVHQDIDDIRQGKDSVIEWVLNQ